MVFFVRNNVPPAKAGAFSGLFEKWFVASTGDPPAPSGASLDGTEATIPANGDRPFATLLAAVLVGGVRVLHPNQDRDRGAAFRPLHRPHFPGALAIPQHHRQCITPKRRKRRAPFRSRRDRTKQILSGSATGA